MKTTRRRFLEGTAAAAAIAAAPGILKAKAQSSDAKTIKAVLHGDLKVFDPVWTTANMTGNHGLLVYDTLLGKDEAGTVHPQMVDKWAISDHNKAYSFQLRDGLKFHDGQDVTAAELRAPN